MFFLLYEKTILSTLVWFSVCSKCVMSCCGKASVIYNPITPIRSKLMGFQTARSHASFNRNQISHRFFFSGLTSKQFKLFILFTTVLCPKNFCVSRKGFWDILPAPLFSCFFPDVLFSCLKEFSSSASPSPHQDGCPYNGVPLCTAAMSPFIEKNKKDFATEDMRVYVHKV